VQNLEELDESAGYDEPHHLGKTFVEVGSGDSTHAPPFARGYRPAV